MLLELLKEYRDKGYVNYNVQDVINEISEDPEKNGEWWKELYSINKEMSDDEFAKTIRDYYAAGTPMRVILKYFGERTLVYDILAKISEELNYRGEEETHKMIVLKEYEEWEDKKKKKQFLKYIKEKYPQIDIHRNTLYKWVGSPLCGV